ncbi:uncharacterized protein LOC113278920 [Papaver somniferum]|uniref:uncharacterized protein LOC113278920 n=1 Tax=Papaver somniferum TaxID=3469 RepID=UPI000E6F7CBD|nr:uncharacterized protein LOC113278920 [Papaver somniferum]
MPDSFWEKLWKLNLPQRIILFTWKCLQNALLVNFKLARFMKVSLKCPFGCDSDKTIEHLLFHCSFAKSVWDSNPNPIHLNFDCSVTFLDMCKTLIEKPSIDIPLEIILTKIWFIWKERCNWVFGKKTETIPQLALEIQKHLKYCHLEKQDNTHSQDNLEQLEKENWRLPLVSRLKINVDAAWMFKTEPPGYLDGGFMGMTGSGYRGTIGPAANGKRILSGGVVAAQMPAAAMSLGADSGKMAEGKIPIAEPDGVVFRAELQSSNGQNQCSFIE